MDFDMTRINHQPLKVRLVYQSLQQLFPNPLIPPAAKAPVSIFSIPIIWRQVTPGIACTQNPEYSVDEEEIIACISTPCSFTPKQVRFQQYPNSIRNIMAAMSNLHLKLLGFDRKESIKNLETCQSIDDTI
jgi:hypothetical protein